MFYWEVNLLLIFSENTFGGNLEEIIRLILTKIIKNKIMIYPYYICMNYKQTELYYKKLATKIRTVRWIFV
jgi:hypothetical protein